jgi:hypothetical protein
MSQLVHITYFPYGKDHTTTRILPISSESAHLVYKALNNFLNFFMGELESPASISIKGIVYYPAYSDKIKVEISITLYGEPIEFHKTFSIKNITKIGGSEMVWISFADFLYGKMDAKCHDLECTGREANLTLKRLKKITG